MRASVRLYGCADNAGSSKVAMSPPETKVRPAQAITSAAASRSCSKALTAAPRPSITAADNALTGALSMRSTPTRPLRE